MFAKTVGVDDSFDFFPRKNPDLGADLAGCRLRCRAGGAAGGFSSAGRPRGVHCLRNC